MIPNGFFTKELLLFKVLRTSFNTFTFLAFCLIFNSAINNHSFHNDFATTIRANEFLCCNSCTRVFTSSSHYVPPNRIFVI